MSWKRPHFDRPHFDQRHVDGRQSGQLGDMRRVARLGDATALPAWVPRNLPFGELVEVLESVFPGQKGWAITQALKASGYVQDPAGFDRDYDAGRAQIDPYLQHLDVAQLTDDVLTAPAQAAARDYLPALAGGVASGVLGTLVLSALLR